MASATYTRDAFVIRKTKLSESDLIIDMISDDANLIRAVAKSARKPGNSFSNRLDLYNVAHITCAKCKRLDIVRECKLIESHNNVRSDFKKQIIAASICEFAWRATWDGNVHENLFDFLIKTIDLLDKEDDADHLLLVAALLKLLALEGFRPSLDRCSKCSKKIETSQCVFSYQDGGVICNDCSSSNDMSVDLLSARELSEMRFLLSKKYEDILEFRNELYCADRLLAIVDKMIHFHVGYQLRALKVYYSTRNFVS